MSFAAIATQYAHDVVNGKVVACKWVKLACKRHLDDLVRATIGAWPYTWNPELTDAAGKKYFPAERICTFAQLMPHIKGDWAARRQLIKLEPWQVFTLAVGFGWINRATGKRRFRVIDLYVPRKNAKSTLASIIGLYMLALDGEFGAEVYSGATSQDQALEVFRPAQLMARATPRFTHRYGVSVAASNLAIIDNNSKFEPVIGKPGDGASPSCAIIDEYHEHKTAELFDTMQTGMGARSQPLILVITTAGSDISGPCYQHQLELQKILEGVVEGDQRFGIIFTIDEGDDWTKPECLLKANPNYGVSVSADFLIEQQRIATDDSRKQNVFKTKHLNIWVQAASPWLNLHNLQQCGDAALTLESMAGEECTVGLDLASKQDIASLVFEFRREVAGKDHYFVISRNYVPEDALRKPENAHYQAWVNSGHLIATPGNMISLSTIEDFIVQTSELVPITSVAKDPYGGQQMGANLQEGGFEVVDIPQHVRYLSDPMKDIAALIDAGQFHHDNNPCYVWQMGNVEVYIDRNENMFPRKARPQNKIDAAVATICAHNRAMLGESSGDLNGFLSAPVIA